MRRDTMTAQFDCSPQSPGLDRRRLLKRSFLSLLTMTAGVILPGCGGGSDGAGGEPAAGDDSGAGPGPDSEIGGGATRMVSNIGDLGPLRTTPDANGLLLPEGFSSREIARTDRAPVGTAYLWHGKPDGGAVFETQAGGWIYVSNSELAPGDGGVGALEFDADGNLIDAFPLLTGSSVNCAGGKTPWGTWLSCEEYGRGVVWECFPFQRSPDGAIRRDALGVFYHEAAVTDPATGIVYMTEDREDSCFYRFVPNTQGDLSSGKLQAAVVDNMDSENFALEGNVSWVDVPDPSASGLTVRQQAQDAGAARFNRGEGAWFHDGAAFFSTTGDNVIWAYQPTTDDAGVLLQIYNRTSLFPNDKSLNNVDNLTGTAGGDLVVAEDGDDGDLQIQAITPDGQLVPLLTLRGHNGDRENSDKGKGELTGPAFDPSGTRLYFSSQKGTPEDFTTYGKLIGVTFEVTGPFVVPESAPEE